MVIVWIASMITGIMLGGMIIGDVGLTDLAVFSVGVIVGMALLLGICVVINDVNKRLS